MKKRKSICLLLCTIILVVFSIPAYATGNTQIVSETTSVQEKKLIDEWGYIVSNSGEITYTDNPDLFPCAIGDIILKCDYYYISGGIYEVQMHAVCMSPEEYFVYHSLQVLTPEDKWVKSEAYHSQGFFKRDIGDAVQFHIPVIYADTDVLVSVTIRTNKATYNFPIHTLEDPK